MHDSDDEYVQSASDDEGNARNGSGGQNGQTGKPSSKPKTAGNFEVARTWENIDEAADGTITGAIEGLLDAGKRRRVLKDTTPIQRGIIRHLVLILDLSSSMLEKDLRPTRYLLTLSYAVEFVSEYFNQNPISQLCIIGMRDGLAVPITDMGGNPGEHIKALTKLREQQPRGDPSLQNAFNMARGALFHTPSHGTREILLIFGSLLSSDPGDVNKTITELVRARIVATVVGLAAEVAVCRSLVTRTNPQVPIAEAYGVPIDEKHYQELFMRATTPPATGVALAEALATSDGDPNAASLLLMGFPSRSVDSFSSLCACHSRPTRAGYTCSRCSAKVCALPATCPVCALTLILSTHLARSYHHLFPLRNWVEVSWERAAEIEGAQQQQQQVAERNACCFGCMMPFPAIPQGDDMLAIQEDRRAQEDRGGRGKIRKSTSQKAREDGGQNVSESGRYECETCHKFFCIDCDTFAHNMVHNCPGCQSSSSVHDDIDGTDGNDVSLAEASNGNAGLSAVNNSSSNSNSNHNAPLDAAGDVVMSGSAA